MLHNNTHLLLVTYHTCMSHIITANIIGENVVSALQALHTVFLHHKWKKGNIVVRRGKLMGYLRYMKRQYYSKPH